MNDIKYAATFKAKGSILSISRAQNCVVVVTQGFQAFRIDTRTLSLKSLTTLMTSPTQPHQYAKTTSANNAIFCLSEPSSKAISIGKVAESMRIALALKPHKSDISAACVSQDGRLLASGGEDGRIHIFETEKFKKIFSLPYRPDYIAALNFSKDSRYLFASCFDKSNAIFDCQRAKNIGVFNTAEVVEWGDFYDHNGKLFAILRNLNALTYDTRTNQVINLSGHFASWPSHFFINDRENVAIVGARDSVLYLIDIAENKKIFSLKLANTTGISAICIHDDYVFIGFCDGELVAIDYNDCDEEFEAACAKKDYKKAAALLDKNIFLSILPCARVFDEDWERILKAAVELLGDNKIEAAMDLVAPFTRDPAKKEAFEMFLAQKDVLKQFQELINNKFYEEAYNMSLQIKFLARTSHFEALENIWHREFSAAKKILEENPHNVEAAKKHLVFFMKTPKKDAAMQLLNNLRAFKDAEKFVKEQNFKDYFALCAKFGYLKDTELYGKVLDLGKSLFEKTLECEKEGKYDRFSKLATFLQSFPTHRDAITTHLVGVNKKLEMLNLIKQNKTFEVYKLAAEFEELQYLEEFKAFVAQFEGVYKEAQNAAFKGTPQALDGIFKDYLRVNYWHDKIAQTYKLAYLEEFELKMRGAEQVDWARTIARYVGMFGRDDDIVNFCDKFKKSDLLENDDESASEPFRFQKTLISQ